MILSIYALMGENVSPPIDDLTKKEHIDLAIKVSLNTIFIILLTIYFLKMYPYLTFQINIF